jgi:hypothetical protein
MIRFVEARFVLLVLGGCLWATGGVSQGLEGVCLKSSSGRIDPAVEAAVTKSLGATFSGISTALSVPAIEFLSPLIEEYNSAMYSPDEIVVVLQDLLRLTRLEQSELSRNQADTNTRGVECARSSESPSNREELVVFVDPTCGYCLEVVELIRSLQRSCPAVMPPVFYRVIPSSSAISQKVSTLLESMRQQDQALYCGALFDSLHTVREDDEESFRTFREQYVRLISKKLEEDAPTLPEGVEISPPFAVYRGRVIHRVGMFNPFAGSTDLLYTIIMISFGGS